jgi:hypothetical protein
MTRYRMLVALALAAAAGAAGARVTGFEVTSRDEVAGGRPFGLAGRFEKIAGRVHFAVAPGDPHQARIVDLDKAPRNARGEVEFSADFYILRPKGRGNGALLLEIPNRGGKAILAIADRGRRGGDPEGESELGDGFLLREGYTVAWLGWQADVRDEIGLMRLHAPAARGVSGLVRSDFAVPEETRDHPLAHVIVGRIGGLGYPVADPEDPRDVLTVRDGPLGPRQVIPRTRWRFAMEVNGKLVPDRGWVHLDGGFSPGRIYEVVYVARDPAVAGLGFAAVRDFASWLKHDPGAPAPVRRAYAVGISQSGRFLRHFLYEGMNADEQDRIALDGVIAHVAGAGRGSFNHRFAQPSRDAQPLSPLFYPVDLFPFADAPARDPVTGETAGLLDRAAASRTVPKIFYTNTSYEYWGRAASLVHTTPDGARDLALRDDVRVYFLAGLQHFSPPFPPAPEREPELRSRELPNPNPVAWLWRALISDLDAWVDRGAAPPPSVYPRIADGTLVPLPAWRFPKLPGVRPPRDAQRAYHLDFGPEFRGGVATREPPRVGEPFPVLVPQADADGNDRGGVVLPELAVPLATYTGWNLRDPSIGAPDARVSFLGSYLPLARTAEERRRRGDPRPSIAERYAGREEYLGRYAEAAAALVRARFLLPGDLPDVLERGRAEWDYAVGERAAGTGSSAR